MFCLGQGTRGGGSAQPTISIPRANQSPAKPVRAPGSSGQHPRPPGHARLSVTEFGKSRIRRPSCRILTPKKEFRFHPIAEGMEVTSVATLNDRKKIICLVGL